MRKELQKLKGLLEQRISADEEKISHTENFNLKLVGTIGDLAKKIIELEARIKKLEGKIKSC